MGFQVRSYDVIARRDKATFAALVIIYLASVAYYALWWFQPQHIPRNWTSLGFLGLAMDTFYFICLSFVIWRGVIQNLFTYWVVSTMKAPVHQPPEPGLRVAMMTCFVPGKEPYGMLEKTLSAMTRVSYPHDTWVLDEGDDPVVKDMCSRLGVKHFSRKGVLKYNRPSGKFKARTKGGNHNSWADRHGDEYDIVAQMDVDYVPNPDFLERTLGYFGDPKVAFVGSPQIYGNQSESWIARGAAEQAFIFYGPMQKGLYGKGMQLFIGANHVYRTEAWRDIDGYAGHIVEDHLTGMRLYAKGWKSVYVPEILCVGEGPPDMPAYLGQQMRWSYGLMDILLRHTPRLFPKLQWSHRVGYVFLQFFYFFGLAQFLGVILTTLYLMFGLTAAYMGFADWLLHAIPPFVVNILVFRWLQKFNIDPETENGQGIRGILLMFAAWPVYALAFVYVILGRGLTYFVTPKGSANRSRANRPSLRGFTAHLASAGISLLGLAVYPLTGFDWPPLIFWASVNFATMLGVLIATWLPLIPAITPTLPRFRPLGFPIALSTATTAIVLFVSINVPTVIDVLPWSARTNLAASVKTNEATSEAPKLVQARFLQAGSRGVAIGALASSDELERVSKISHSFITWRPEELSLMNDSVKTATQNNQVSMISWEPRLSGEPDMSPTRPDRTLLQRIEKGEFDSYIAEAAAILKATQQPVILRFGHEMDLPDDGLHPWSWQPPEVYIAAYRHVYQIFEQEQANNVIWLWSPGGRYDSSGFQSLQWYPGDRYVDMLGMTVFVYWRWEEAEVVNQATHSYRSPQEAIGPVYDQFVGLGKPIVLAEVGVDLHPDRQAERTVWLLSMFDYLKQDYLSSVVGLVFYNAQHPLSNFEINWELDDEEMRLVTTAIRGDDYFETPITPASGMVSRP